MPTVNMSRSNETTVPFFLDKSGSPKTWFLLLENRFKSLSIKAPDTKFYFLTACLAPELLQVLSEELVNASESPDPYNEFKSSLSLHYNPSPKQLFEEYFLKQKSLNESPSLYLEKAISSIEMEYPIKYEEYKDDIKTVFLSSLPEFVYKELKDPSNIDLKEIAKQADKLVQNDKSTNGNDSELSLASLSHEICKMKVELEMLKKELSEAKIKPKKKQTKLDANKNNVTKTPPTKDGLKELDDKFNYSKPVNPYKKLTSLEKNTNNNNSNESNYYDNNSCDMKCNNMNSSPTHDTNSMTNNSPKKSNKPLRKNLNTDKYSRNYAYKPYDKNLNAIACESFPCFFHMKFGSDARKCQPGCNFSPKLNDMSKSKVCIYHGKYGKSATNCAEGCTYTSYKPSSQLNDAFNYC